jgi:uncharacterized phage-associated protein
MGPYDARAVANLLLDYAAADGKPVTNLLLQKLTYFAHGMYLVKMGKPLVRGEFEAWRFGPVHPHVYVAFRSFGDNNIAGRALKVDPATGRASQIPDIEDASARATIRRMYDSLRDLSASDLVDMSHAKGGPWDFVVQRSKKASRLAMRITDGVIVERFKHHKISLGHGSREVPNENSPFA